MIELKMKKKWFSAFITAALKYQSYQNEYCSDGILDT
jgi:hypothetical protein